MTLVPNRRQPLSGSKILAILLTICFFSQASIAKDKDFGNGNPLIVSFLLPLNLQQLDSMNAATIGSPFKGNTVGLDCWQGAKLALDSLSSLGLHLDVNVFDTERKGFSFSNSSFLDALSKSNLVIGPIYPESFTKAATFSKIYKIPVVSPLAPAPLAEFDDELFIGMYPTIGHHAKADALFVAKNFPNANFIVVHTGDPADDKLSKPFTGYLFSQKHASTLVKLQKATPDFKQLTLKLVPDKPNVILAPTLSNTFLTQFYSYLHTDSLHEIHVFTHPNFSKLESFNLDLIQNTNTYISSANNLDYTNPEVIAFIKRYRQAYANDPTDEACRMYNVVLFLGKKILDNGDKFMEAIPESSWKGLYGSYHFQCDSNGCHNTAVSIYKYSNFDLIKQE